MSVLHGSLDLSNPDNVMLWTVCCLGLFGFLKAGEFTTDGPFDLSVHLTTADLQVDPNANPQSFRVFIRCSKTDPLARLFHLSQPWLCSTLSNYPHLQGPGAGHLFLFQDGLFLGYCYFCNPPFRLLAFQGSFLAIALEFELSLLWLRKASLIISSRHFVDGQTTRTCYMCSTQWTPSFWSQQGFPSRYGFSLFLGYRSHEPLFLLSFQL